MRFFTICVTLACTWSSVCQAEDWPQFRGPNADGVATGIEIPVIWGTESNVSWKALVPGEGWSSPVVSNGKVIVTTAVSDGAKNKETNHRWEIHCFDEKSGEKLWMKVATAGKPRIATHRANSYASETPVTDGERIVAYFGMTGLYCYDFDGNLLWSKDLGAFKMRNGWGTASSPAMHEGLVFVQVDNEGDSFLAAFDATNGDEKWRRERDEGSNWGSAIIWKNSKRSELVTVGRTVRSYDPATGKLLWALDTGVGGITSSPATAGDVLLVGSSGRRGRGGGLWAVKADASGELTEDNGIAWTNDQAGPSMSSPLAYEGYVYILARDGGLVTCLNAETGETAYRERLTNAGQFWASPWAYDGKVFLPNANGTTYVLNAGPKFEVIGMNELEGQFWATSAIANGRIFIRSKDTLFSVASGK